jgi:hypothetical protein
MTGAVKNISHGRAVLAFAVVMVLIVFSYVYAHDRIRVVHLDRIFNPAYGFPEGYRETYFAREFPSSQAIKEYLSDATILFSQPPSGNELFYFNSAQEFISWRDGLVSSGSWRIFPALQIIELGGRWRVTVVQRFCSLVSDMPADTQQDNCYDVTSIESILSRGPQARREYKKGNVFNISADKPVPFRLPESAITIDSLLSNSLGARR